MELAPGTLLVAQSGMTDPVFRRGVILVLGSTERGTRAINITGGDNQDNYGQGGPLDKSVMYFLHRAQPGDVHTVGATGYAAAPLDANDNAQLRRIYKELETPGSTDTIGPGILLLGYGQWAPGVLEEEVTKGLWQKTTQPLDALMKAPTRQRWNFAQAYRAPPQAPRQRPGRYSL